MVPTESANSVSLRDLINPHERQDEYLKTSDRCRYPLYGGARGGGKSYIERWRQVRFLLKLTQLGFRSVQTGLFSQTYKEARKRQFLPAKVEFPEWLGESKEGNLEFHFHRKWGGHRIAFLNLEDPSQYKSDQFATIGIEELTLCPNPIEIIDILSGSLRWPGVDWTPMGFTTNPDGPGHSEVKRLWVTRDFSRPDDEKRDPSQFAFVRALPADNPHLPQEYVDEVLSRLPDSLRKPWLEGSWDLFEGQRFEFHPRIHMLKEAIPLEQLEPCKFYRSLDYGFHNPYACGWYAVKRRDNGRRQVYKIREDSVSGLKVYQQIDRVHRITEELGIPASRIELSWLDTACWKEEDDGLSIADKFIQGGIPVVQALKDRPTGFVAIENMLRYELDPEDHYTVVQEPELMLYPQCVLTAQQITDAMWDPKRPGDILHPEAFRDDVLDETRYFALSHTQLPQIIKQDTQDDYDRRVYAAMSGKRFKRKSA